MIAHNQASNKLLPLETTTVERTLSDNNRYMAFY